jgi:hypothetical protein
MDSATCATTGVNKAESSGMIPVRTAASARSARDIRAKTGTTGAKGAAASRTIPASIVGGRARASAPATAREGTTTKFRIRMALSRQ